MAEPTRPTVSIIIKAFNEAHHIAGAVESALAALSGIDGEIILADSASTDRTIAIAKHYPIKIVRLDNAADRSCGAGAQLGFQYSRGEFLCLIDGDMRLHAPFVAASIRFLDDNPTVGGVGGAIVNRNIDNLEYAQRANRPDPDRRPGLVSRLNGCGLYRRSAIAATGYLTDRNLHGGEELELAGRLQAAGWALARIDCLAVEHYCRRGNAYRLLLQRMRTRNACGPGELIRAAIGRPQFAFILRNDRNSLLCGLVALWWASIALAAAFGSGIGALLTVPTLLAFPFAVMTWRWRSLRNGLYSVAVWNALTLCFLPGFLRRRKPPTQWMTSTLIRDASAGERPNREAIA
jgi:glycosyltransferase involved in cell wall biosynthesis